MTDPFLLIKYSAVAGRQARPGGDFPFPDNTDNLVSITLQGFVGNALYVNEFHGEGNVNKGP